MNSSNRFSQRLETTVFVTESADAPKIKGGGASSSSLFNRYHDAVAKDVAGLAVTVNQVNDKAARVSAATAAQAAAISAIVSSLSGSLDALSSDDSLVLADLFVEDYISTDTDDTNADINHLFGQATLPIQSQTDLLTQVDSRGNYIVSDTVELGYSYEDDPDQFVYINSADGIAMLLRNQAWLGDSSNPVWIKLLAPLQYLGLTPNVLEIYPMPAFAVDISDLSYQQSGAGLGSSWTTIDLSYLPGYNSDTGVAEKSGPIRVHLPGVPITQVRFKITPSDGVSWGLYNLRLLSVEYEQTGSLTVLDPEGRTVSDVLIRGKDPEDLAQLPVSGTGAKTRIDMSSTTTSASPVITGVVMSIS